MGVGGCTRTCTRTSRESEQILDLGHLVLHQPTPTPIRIPGLVPVPTRVDSDGRLEINDPNPAIGMPEPVSGLDVLVDHAGRVERGVVGNQYVAKVWGSLSARTAWYGIPTLRTESEWRRGRPPMTITRHARPGILGEFRRVGTTVPTLSSHSLQLWDEHLAAGRRRSVSVLRARARRSYTARRHCHSEEVGLTCEAPWWRAIAGCL